MEWLSNFSQIMKTVFTNAILIPEIIFDTEELKYHHPQDLVPIPNSLQYFGSAPLSFEFIHRPMMSTLGFLAPPGYVVFIMICLSTKSIFIPN